LDGVQVLEPINEHEQKSKRLDVPGCKEDYLPRIGEPWISDPLSEKFHQITFLGYISANKVAA